MKRIAALLLILVLCLPVIAMTGCKDPLKVKMNELDDTYALLGNRYTRAVYVCQLAGVYNVDSQKELNDKFAAWKTKVQDAGDTIDMRLDYDESEMDAFIADWKVTIDELNAVIDQYEVETETAAVKTAA
jgi:hypothetical protein